LKSAIINIGIGNLGSISSAIYNQGYDFDIIDNSNNFNCAEYSHLVLPGVGSYDYFQNELNKQLWPEKINLFKSTGKPILGICVGMQVLSNDGEEGTKTIGLKHIDGSIKSMKNFGNIILPHMGWNSVNFIKEHPVFENLKSGVDFYFAHSYCYQNTNEKNILAFTNYHSKFPSIVHNENVIGVQFHPEKSFKSGLQFLDNFLRWTP